MDTQDKNEVTGDGNARREAQDYLDADEEFKNYIEPTIKPAAPETQLAAWDKEAK
jgi:hypothetical protein